MAGWYSCDVTKAGPAEEGRIYIALTDHGGKFFNREFQAAYGLKREMLATALTAIANIRPVHASLESVKEGSLCDGLFITGRIRQFLPTFRPVYGQAGIGGYDLARPGDRAFAFDYDHSGKLDHLALYRPGTGTIWILSNTDGTFSPVFHEGDPGNGIGGYDLARPGDRAFAFDYDHSGKLDHLALYRPGTGTIWILSNTDGTFSPVFHEGDPGNGIGGYDLAHSGDRAFAFDYDHSGKLDHLALYRPGTGTMWILSNTDGTFSPVFHEGDPGNGIGGYDLAHSGDRAFAFDYDHSGKLDHLALYRPGTGTMWILSNTNGTFSPVFHEGDPGNGIGGYDLAHPGDRAFAFDYDHSGKLDHLVLYRPGEQTIWVLKNELVLQ